MIGSGDHFSEFGMVTATLRTNRQWSLPSSDQVPQADFSVLIRGVLKSEFLPHLPDDSRGINTHSQNAFLDH